MSDYTQKVAAWSQGFKQAEAELSALFDGVEWPDFSVPKREDDVENGVVHVFRAGVQPARDQAYDPKNGLWHTLAAHALTLSTDDIMEMGPNEHRVLSESEVLEKFPDSRLHVLNRVIDYLPDEPVTPYNHARVEFVKRFAAGVKALIDGKSVEDAIVTANEFRHFEDEHPKVTTLHPA